MDVTQAREKLIKYSNTQLQDALDETWTRRTELETASAAITEELIIRKLRDHHPELATVTLIEDHSHDAPHGHFYAATDSNGTEILRGIGDMWHDLPYATEVDELIYDLYTLSSSKFRYSADTELRLYTFS